MPRYAAKVDDNQKEIVEYLRAHGCFVQSLANTERGLDLLVGYRGYWMILEVKDGNKPQSAQKLTLQEARWLLDLGNRAPAHVVNNPEQAWSVVKEECRVRQ